MGIMEENISVLVDAKTEYTKQLTNILIPFIFEGIKSIYDETSIYCINQGHTNVLMIFQEKLSLIPNWNQDIINKEYSRIMTDSGCDWLDELVTAVFLSQTKILTSIKKNTKKKYKKKKKINLKIPKIEHFIHKCYIECAREFWKNPFLFSKKCNQSEYQRNCRESQKIIGLTIEETIRKLLPVKNILKEYLGEEQDDISFIDDKYKKNLRKIVQKEIEICQNKGVVSMGDNKDAIEEGNDLVKQDDLEEIKEMISSDLYTKKFEDTQKNIINLNNMNILNIDDAEEKTILKNKQFEKEIKLENTIDTEKEIKLENTIDTEKEIKLETINFSKITNDLEVSRKYHKSEIDKIEEQNVDIINDYKDDDIDLSTLNLKKEGLDSLKIEKLDLDNDLDFIDNDLDFVDNINESQNTQNININAVLPEEIDLENVLPNKITLNETLEKDNNVKKIVIDNKTTLNKYTHDKKKNYSFFD